MIKAAGNDKTTGERVVILGLSAENIARLKQDQPIQFSLRPFGFEGSALIFYGETEQEMVDDLRKMGVPLPEAKAWEDNEPTPSGPPSADGSND